MKQRTDKILELGGPNVATEGSVQPQFPTEQTIFFSGKLLGEGGYGQVVLITDVSTGIQYAAKEFNRCTWSTKWQRKLGTLRGLPTLKKKYAL